MKMPRVSPKIPQNLSSSTRTIGAVNRSNQIQNGPQVVVMKNGGSTGSGGSNGRNHSGQSTLPSSPNNSGYVTVDILLVKIQHLETLILDTHK